MTEITDIQKDQEAVEQTDTASTHNSQIPEPSEEGSDGIIEALPSETEEQDELYMPNGITDDEDDTDFSDDITELKAKFPELRSTDNIQSLENPKRYAELRSLGLSAAEAYLATNLSRRTRDNRSHLGGNVPIRAHVPGSSMSSRDLRLARDIFNGVSDAEILRLYNKVTGNS